MRYLTAIAIFFSLSTSYAQKAELTVLDPFIETKELEKSFNIHRPSNRKSSLPDKNVRNRILSKVSLSKDWDEVKKDIFYMDLKSKDLTSLRKKYPELTAVDLKSLKEAAK